jgi:hypothetical protein
MNGPQPLRVAYSIGQIYFLTALALPLCILSLYVAWIGDAETRRAGLVAAAIFGANVILLLRLGFRRRPRLVIDDVGIHVGYESESTVRWEEIASIGAFKRRRLWRLTIRLRDPKRYGERLSRWRRLVVRADAFFGDPTITIPMIALTPGIDTILEYLHAHHPEKITG